MQAWEFLHWPGLYERAIVGARDTIAKNGEDPDKGCDRRG